MTGNSPRSSNTYNYAPTGSEMILEAFARIEMFGPELETRHIIEARRSINLAFAHLPNRGVSLWLVGDTPLVLPTIPGQTQYQLPGNVVDIYDAWRRIYTPNTTFSTIGNTISPALTGGGQVMVTGAGEVMVFGPGSGTLSTVAGSNEVTLHWPSHGLSVGSPLFWLNWTEIGGLVLNNFNVVDNVIDQNNVTFQAASAAPLTSTLMGATGCVQTTSGSATVDIILPNHNLSVGQNFVTGTAITVGGITIPAGTYPVTAVINFYDFQIQPAVGSATSTTGAFLGGGQIGVTSQSTSTSWTDIFLWPLSRDDYAMLPDKQDPGVPTQYWFDRTSIPSVTLWPVPPVITANQYVAFIAYRMRRVMDFNPQMGQTPDLPSRFWDWGCAELSARMAEKFKPARFAEKLQLAKLAWDEASAEDREKVSFYVAPQMEGYFS